MVEIPAGSFQMGSNNGDPDEKPVHTVYLDTYYIDVYEVSNKLYKKFIDDTGHRKPKFWDDAKFNLPGYPVVGVTWEDAKAYAEWAGKRLPTEAEWEKAARGGLVREKYPWGYGINHDKANYQGTGSKDTWSYTAPIGSFEPNGYGLYHVAGNVWEWCSDWYSPTYYANSPRQNPKGPDSGKGRILRGGGWSSFPPDLRVSERFFSASAPEDKFGFRCAKDAPKAQEEQTQ
ncbi:SUMF1/EgtB/PvdO family nonheme iron enzyme [Candidatus Poribacteria bacterium]|nr:SUMF1/EgtB/PvdO family nonheme iron enzyme [Candidatus Poribacteria bacterium]